MEVVEFLDQLLKEQVELVAVELVVKEVLLCLELQEQQIPAAVAVAVEMVVIQVLLVQQVDLV